MKIRGTDGKIYKWNLGQYIGRENTNPSDLHIKAREFLKKSFPACVILEEVYIESEKLFLDFYISNLKICIEGMGSQHDNFSLFMHKDKLNFSRAKSRDSRKAEFCRLNGIKLIYFYPDEDESDWRIKLGLN